MDENSFGGTAPQCLRGTVHGQDDTVQRRSVLDG
jgi:hypothetical protein